MAELTTQPGTMSPLGVYIHALGFLDAAEILVREQISKKRSILELPIRALYSHAWEAVIKACLLRQGWTPDALKMKIGHNLELGFENIKLGEFSVLKLSYAAPIIPILNLYHRNRFNFYPGTGLFPMLEMSDLSKQSERLRLDRQTAAKVFGLPY